MNRQLAGIFNGKIQDFRMHTASWAKPEIFIPKGIDTSCLGLQNNGIFVNSSPSKKL
jgi:hypothetical protein